MNGAQSHVFLNDDHTLKIFKAVLVLTLFLISFSACLHLALYLQAFNSYFKTTGVIFLKFKSGLSLEVSG